MAKIRTGRALPDKELEKLAEELIEYAKTEELPFLGKFFLDHNLSTATSSDKKNLENAKFAFAVELAKSWCEYKVWFLGILKKIDTGMAIFTLKNIAGWRDKIEDLTRYDDISNEEIEILDIPKGSNGDYSSRFERFVN